MVYKVLGGGEIMALKQFNKTSREIEYHILREIGILKQLNHPHIIAYQDAFLEGEKISLIMEYGGEPLSEYIKWGYKDRMPILVELSLQIVEGIRYLHARGIIHRDLKPQNILVRDGIIKICDFGLAKHLAPYRENDNTRQPGSLAYRAPELFNNNHYSTEVDLWALGCILYEMAKGSKAFNGTSDLSTLTKILRTIPVKEEDMLVLGLDMININSCNLTPYHRLEVYESLCLDEFRSTLELMQDLIKKLLILSPSARLGIEEVRHHPLFQIYEETEIFPEARVTLGTGRITISSELREIHVRGMRKLKERYKLSTQTLLLGVGIMDRYLAESRDTMDLDAICLCCLVIASKYNELHPLCLKDFSTNHSLKKLVLLEQNIITYISFDIYHSTILDTYKTVWPAERLEGIAEELLPQVSVSELEERLLNYEH